MMRRLGFVFLFLFAAAAWGQTDTSVVGNAITSSNGILYAHGSLTATLVDINGNDLSSSPVLIGGVPVTIPQRQTNLDSGANFAIPLVPRATISQPNNTNWKLNICSQNPAGNPPGVPPMVCFIYTVTVGTTSPQDISSTLNAIPPPPIQGGGGGGGGVCGNAGELIWNNASTCSSTTGMTWTSSIQYLNNPTGSISASFISGQNVGTGGGYLDTFAWNPANGLPSHSVACIGAAGTAIVCPVNTTSWSGIVVSTSVSMGIATVVASGNAQCQFDGAATVGDIAQTSTVTAGYCHDSGSGSLPVLSGGVAIGPIVASTGSLATVLMAGSAVPYPGVSSNGSGGLSVPAGTVSAQTVSAQTVTGQTVTAQAVVGNTVGGLRYAAPYGGLPPAQALNQTVFSTMDDIYTNQPSSITSWSITSNVATFQAVNSYVAGQNIQLHDFNSAAAGFFNQQFVNVASATPTQFTVSFTHANASGSDTGSATLSNSYSFQNGYPPNLPNASHWTDLRRGKTQNQYFNWGFEAFKNTFSGFPAAESTNCVQWLPFYGAFSNGTGACHQMTFIDSSPGVSIGNPGVGANPALNWLTMLGNVVNMTSYGAGIREANGSYFTHYGIGDTANYWYINSHGGAKATSDEGTEAAIRITEDMAQATGSCQVGCAPYTSTGSNPNQQIKLIYTGAGTANGGTQGVGRPIIDLTQSPISTTYTNATTGLDGTMQALTIAASVPVSNAWGRLVANVQPNWSDLQSPPNYGTLLTFQVNSITGGFVTGVPLCIASEFNDNVVPITVTGSGTVTITAIVSRPHVGGAWVFQGGMCGYGLEAVNATATASPYGNGVNRYLVHVLGSTGANTLQVTYYLKGANQAPGFGNFGYGVGTITSASSSGTTLYATGVSAGSITAQTMWETNKNVIIITASSEPAFVGQPCTNLQWINVSSMTCTISTLSGTHAAATGTTWQLAVPTNGGPPYVLLSAINLWPMQEVLDVNDYQTPFTLSAVATHSGSTTTYTGTGLTNACPTANSYTYTIGGFTNQVNNGPFVCTSSTATTLVLQNSLGVAESNPGTASIANPVDGTLTLMPGPVQFAPGDLIAELNSDAGQFIGLRTSANATNPYAASEGLLAGVSGSAAQGGGYGGSAASVIGLSNSQSDSYYIDNGGMANPPNAIQYAGSYYTGLQFLEAPSNGLGSNASLIQVTPNANQRSNPQYFYNLFASYTPTPTLQNWMQIVPYSGAELLASGGAMSLYGGLGLHVGGLGPNNWIPVDGLNMSDRILFVPTSAPTIVSVTPGPGYGSLADATTYCYKEFIRSQTAGFGAWSAPSAEVCATSGSNGGHNTMKITVGLVANQPNGGPYICGRTSGTELQIGSIAVGNYQTNVTFIDDGSVVTPSGQCGNLGSQYPFLDQAQYVGLNSYPTAFSAKLTAPNSIAASYTELLPLTATAGQLVDSANAAASVAGNIPSFSNATFRLQDSGKTLPLAAVLTTTAAATDNVTVTGMTSSGHCSLAATNASAATNIATTYISAKAANQITVTHTATASMTYDVICTAY